MQFAFVALTHLPENVKFVIVGTGIEQEALEKMAAYYELEDRVIFEGFVEHLSDKEIKQLNSLLNKIRKL